jgi:hypothetical protein
MKESINQINDKEEASKTILDYLSMFGEASENDIENLKKQLSPEFSPIFEKYTCDQKMIHALVHKLPVDDIKNLIKIAKDMGKQNNMLAFHDINNVVDRLMNHTKDTKYDCWRL